MNSRVRIGLINALDYVQKQSIINLRNRFRNFHNHEIIDILRENGFRVRIRHYRRFHPHALRALSSLTARSMREVAHLCGQSRSPSYLNVLHVYRIDPRGGTTVLTFTGKNGQTAEVTARCRPDEQYNKGHGIRLCLERFLSFLVLGTFCEDPTIVIESFPKQP